MKSLKLLLLLLFSNFVFGQTKYEKDFNEFWEVVNDNYAYFEEQNINWNKVKELYEPKVKKVSSDYEFIAFLEEVLTELYNGHCSLNTNLNTSNKLIPTGQDIYVEKIENRYFITDIRTGFGVAMSGLKIGDEILLFNGKPIAEQLTKFLPKTISNHTDEMHQYALNMLFAGTHDVKRVLTINDNGKHKNKFPDSLKVVTSDKLLEHKIINKTTAYIKINNSLGEDQLIKEFDTALDSYLNYKNLIIDLTETPSGGNSNVARGIMGRFINKPLAYQQHEYDEKDTETKRMWVEYASPRKKQFKGKVYLIVGHWTGSMGEGIAIGFDAMKRAKIVGTKMAGLIGAVDGFTLSETKIGFQIPTERLYHINGKPRAEYKPTILTKNSEETIKYIEKIK